MKKYNVSIFENPEVGKLDQMITEFINHNNVELINVSMTSTFNPTEDQIVYAAAISYTYEEE